ncbi:MAG: hypothetical protein HYV54_02510 [Parcubacteria group bacterium]|nr:hypothetical protein [Parcubacteria group bacterium]
MFDGWNIKCLSSLKDYDEKRSVSPCVKRGGFFNKSAKMIKYLISYGR